MVSELSNHTRAGRVCMFHVGRSGSTVLADMLARHPRVTWDGELFEPTNKKWQFGADPWRLLRRQLEITTDRIYGFEFKFLLHCQWTGTALPDVVDLLKEEGFDHYIILRRRNSLRRIASSLVGRQTRVYHLKKERHAKLVSITIDVDKVFVDAVARPLLRCLEDEESGFAELSRLLDGRKVLNLTYEEDIEADPMVAYRRLCEYLNIDPVPASVRLARTNPFPLRDVIMNYAEVDKALAGTPFAWMTRD